MERAVVGRIPNKIALHPELQRRKITPENLLDSHIGEEYFSASFRPTVG
jgi:hypothetical protein